MDLGPEDPGPHDAAPADPGPADAGSADAGSEDPGPLVTIFRSRVRPGVEAEYEPLAARMLALARAMPGFVDFKTFVAEDGERVSIVTFVGDAEQSAWRHHPEHLEAQRLGRQRLYLSYSVQVCRPLGPARTH